MSQIVKRKKKGRPPKSDLGRQQSETDLRRSLRRRNVKYVFDLDDYFDDDDELFNDEDRRRREKKLKLLLRLDADASASRTPPGRRVEHAPDTSASSSDKPRKKRKVFEEEEDDDDVDDDDAEERRNDNGNNWDFEEEYEEVGEKKGELRSEDSPPGTPINNQCGLPLPDKKILELILDKLQKKDIYGVYAEPVDPEELPDYHDIIEHPMDFATVRNRLRNGSYATLEQLESDVFLICSNAMQYNSPDTVYYKQARNIRELAEKKFHKIRLKYSERSEKEIKPDQKVRSGPIVKKQMKRSVNGTVQEPMGSDFSYGATLATGGDTQNVINTRQALESEKPGSIDASVEGNYALTANNMDKAEESPQGKGARLGRKSFINDEDRRATYNTSLDLPEAVPESIFATFEGETKQLVPVGLYSDHSYARSLARFAATLGSVAWKVASKRIEHALPPGFKFGRGWVGEYEPLPTPVLMLENCTIKEPPFFAKAKPAPDPIKYEKIPRISVYSKENSGNIQFLEQKLPFFGHAGIRQPPASVITSSFPNKDQSLRMNVSEVKSPFFLSPGNMPIDSRNLSFHHQNLQPRAVVESHKKVMKQVELNEPPSDNKNASGSVSSRHISLSSKAESPKSTNFSPRSTNFSQFGSLKQPVNNGVAFGGLPGSKVAGNREDANTMPSSSSDVAKPASYHRPHDQVQQGLTDPVQLMRMMAEKGQIQNQQKPSNHLPTQTPPFLQPAPPFLSSNGTTNNAAMAAARAWMSVGQQVGFGPVSENTNVSKNQIHANTLYNSAGDMRPQISRFRGEFPMHGHPNKNGSALHAFVPQGPMPMVIGNEIQFQNPNMVFPQTAPGDLSRFQIQSSWRNVSPRDHSRQKQESLPPDLNISFQSSGSPGKPPSGGVLVDSQQPDLALQL